MSKIETTCKVSLKLTSRINIGRRRAHVPISRLGHSPQTPPTPTVQKGPFPDQIGRIAPTETINNPLRTAKAARAASEVKVHVRVEDTVDPPPPPKDWKGLSTGQKGPLQDRKSRKSSLGRPGGWVSHQLWTQSTSPPPFLPHSPERAFPRPKRTHSSHRNH